MSQFTIHGGEKLTGEIVPQGAKNEALQIIPASLLYVGVTLIHNVPDILDVRNLIGLLRDAGAKIKWIENKDNENKTFCKTVSIDNTNINAEYFISNEFVESSKKLRGSLTLLGPALARFRKCIVPKPGGDKIGERPIDTHLLGLRELGVTYKVDKTNNNVFADAKNLKPADFILDEASVTGTANILMAATAAIGVTTIYNAACEPYIQQLCKYISSLGFQISGSGTNLIKIESQNENKISKKIVEHHILPDFLEVASLVGLAAITNSLITIKNVRVDMLGNTMMAFRKIGVNFSIEKDNIVMHDNSCYVVPNGDRGTVPTIYDQPWPMISPDVISIILTTAIQAKGTVMIHQRMFESRLHFVDNLQRMGAQIILCDPHRAVVVGLNRNKKLIGARIESPDIRAGMAMLIAAISADGVSVIQNIEQIDRGYENIDVRLSKLGAKIVRS